MHKSLYISVCLLFLQAGISHGHPPGNIVVQSDSSRTQLMLDVQHVSRDNVGHYIQRIEIQKNDSPAKSYTYRQQVQPTAFSVDIPFKVEEDDTLIITAFSREGGKKSVEWTASEDELAKELIPRRELSRSASTRPSNPDRIREAVPKNSDISKPTIPTDPTKVRPAYSRDPKIARPTHPKDKSTLRPAVTLDPNIAKPTHPTNSDKIKPATPRSNSYSN